MERGANIYAKTDKDNTPLHIASKYGFVPIATVLLVHHNNHHNHHTKDEDDIMDLIHAQNHRGDTPLHVACARGKRDMVELLVASGADIHAKNHQGDMPCPWSSGMDAAAAGLVKDIFQGFHKLGSGDGGEYTAEDYEYSPLMLLDELDLEESVEPTTIIDQSVMA